ncbi:DapH/DapD/GlmU-related protein [Candidatus Aenigmatarchaeota archaeon]
MNNVGKNTIIEGDVEIGENVEIGNNCIIRSHPESKIIIDNDTVIEDFVFIGHKSKRDFLGKDVSFDNSKIKNFILGNEITIGEKSVIRSHSVVYTNVKIGKRFNSGHNVLIREHTEIGDNSVVGSGTIVDGYVKIGNKSQIQSNCYISQSVRIGNGVFVAPNTSFYDNKKIILHTKFDLEGPIVEDYVRIGGSSVILPGVKIGKHSLIGSGSVVTKNIDEKTLAFGNPANVSRKMTEEEIEVYLKHLK